MVRFATEQDAKQLQELNNEFNGVGCVTIEDIQKSLRENRQELVIVDEEEGKLTGFVCVQLKKSFCYHEYMVELTEVYVKEAWRRRGIASAMLAFVEAYCRKYFSVEQLEVLTGEENHIAQETYRKSGYAEDGEVHLAKEIKK